jgi:hypothetical protein
MHLKYVRFKEIGFVLWPKTDDLIHRALARGVGYKPISAGFVEIHGELGLACYGKSESLDLGSRPDDTEELNKQLGFVDCVLPIKKAGA